MAVKETLQFVGDLKIILQGIKLNAKNADDPLRELIRGLERKINEFESYLRSLLRQNDYPNVENVELEVPRGFDDDGDCPKDPSNVLSSEASKGVSREVLQNEVWVVEEGTDDSIGPAPNPITLVPNVALPENERKEVEEQQQQAAAAEKMAHGGGSPIPSLDKNCDDSRFDGRQKGGSGVLLRCRVCRKSFTKACHLQQHVFIKHEGGILDKQVCPFCGKSFETKYLKGHISTAHEGKEVRCDVCSKSFATVSALNVHRKNVHGGRRFACHNCNKSFASKWGLEVHFAKEHEKRSFPCQLCDSVLKTENLLQRHTQGVHERIRHSCPTCSASFTQKSQLTYHVKLKHGQGKEDGRLICEKCKKVFVVPWKMRVHRRKCVSAMEGNVGYAQIAASLASMNELPEKF